MKIKNVKLEWYVINEDFNQHKIVRVNIFNAYTPEYIAKRIKRDKIKTRAQLTETIKRILMNSYWCRAECEVLVKGLFADDDKTQKIDIWYQLEKNLDIIVDYIINKMQIKLEG